MVSGEEIILFETFNDTGWTGIRADQNISLPKLGYDLGACVSLLHNKGLLRTSVLHFKG